MITEIILTQLGETMNEGTIAAWHKQVGERVQKGEALCGVETDKAVLDIESPRAGYLVGIVAPAGTTVPVLKVIGYLADRADEIVGQTAPVAASSESTAAKPSALAPTEANESTEPGPPLRVSPAARRIAREHDIDYRQLAGTGPSGRVVEADVWKQIRLRDEAPAPASQPALAVAPVAAPLAPLAAAPAGADEIVPLSRIRRIIAEKLSQSYHENVHVTLNCEVDMTEAGKLRSQLSVEWEARHGVKVTYTDLVVKAVAKALVEHKGVNATYTSEGLRLHRAINVGVAMAIASGLVVPVIRGVDALPLLEVARQIRQLTDLARTGQIGPDVLRGGTFTITNMGTMGVDSFTPIINGGEGAILGVGRIADRAVVHEGAVVARSTMPLSLSFDHRLIDGAGAAAFLARVKQILESPYLILV